MPSGDDSAGAALVVLAHPEPTSFAAALAHASITALEGSGWDVSFLDLYREGFDPVLSERDFTERAIPGRLQPMDEQLRAADAHTFAADLAPMSSSSPPPICSCSSRRCGGSRSRPY